MFEIEVKFKFKEKSLEEVKNKFKKFDINWTVPIVQKDEIFLSEELKDYKITEGTRILRIRQESISNETLRYILTLKVQLARTLESKEFESIIENRNSVKSMINELGFKKFVEVTKKRMKGSFENYNLCIDQVEGLGLFLEVEYLSPEPQDAQRVQTEICRWVEQLNIGDYDINTIPYDTQIYRKGRVALI